MKYLQGLAVVHLVASRLGELRGHNVFLERIELRFCLFRERGDVFKSRKWLLKKILEGEKKRNENKYEQQQKLLKYM